VEASGRVSGGGESGEGEGEEDSSLEIRGKVGERRELQRNEGRKERRKSATAKEEP